MKFLPLVWAGIWRKPGRAVLTLLSVVNAFLLFGLLQGLAGGLDSTGAATQADALITADRVSQVEPMPISQLAEIKSVPGVAAVTPVVIFHGTYRLPNQVVRGFAVDPEQLAAADSQLTASKAQIQALKATRAGALVPEAVAKQYGWKIGDRIPLKSMMWTNRNGTPVWPLDIVGIYRPDTNDLFFNTTVLVNYDYVDQGRTASNGTTSVFLVRASDPNQANAVAARIDRLFANSAHETKTASEKQLAQESIRQIGAIGVIVRAVTGAVLFALLFSVGAVMIQSVHERTPELGVLKALGFSDGAVLRLILAESMTFCIGFAAIGLLIAAALFPVVKRLIGFDLHSGPVMALGLVIAAALALATGLPPALRASRLQVVDALAGR
jgi:putative ABC transport system permease protein